MNCRQCRIDIVLYLVIVLVTCVLSLHKVSGQHFDPNIDDKAYLDQIESDIQAEVDETRQVLRQQAKYTQDVARNFAGAKIKENLFIALRVLAEKEKESIRLAKKELENKQVKQEDEEEEDETTTRRPNNLFPVVGNLVKVLFGTNNINLTSYVEAISRFLPSPVQTQLLGVVRVIAPARPSTTTLPPPRTTIITIINGTNGTQTAVVNVNGTQVPVRVEIVGANPTTAATTPGSTNSTEDGTTDDEEDGNGPDEDSRHKKSAIYPRQLNLPSLTSSINFLGMLFGGSRPTAAPVQNVRRTATARPAPAVAAAPAAGNGTEETAAGFEEEREQSQQLSLEGLALSVRNGLGDMIRIAPDIFKGAREAVNLISGLSSFIGDLDL